jgi:hypothetical protein
MNRRPLLDGFSHADGADPGAELVFRSTSTDPDTVGGEDTITLVVCQADTYSTTTNTCLPGDLLASTSFALPTTENANATFTLPSIIRDGVVEAYAYLFDQHGHEAATSTIPAVLRRDFNVNNVAPTVVGGDITLNGTSSMILTVPAGQTASFTLDFRVRDANSCVNLASTSEITNYEVSLFRDNLLSTTTCRSGADYNPNNCYPSTVGTSTWNLDCTINTASCVSPSIDFVDVSCEFPLWFLADPTDTSTNTPASFSDDIWSVGVAGVDDNFATGTMATTTNPQEVISFNAFELQATQIPYGDLEPGENSGMFTVTTTVLTAGNTGIDQLLAGESMCERSNLSILCPDSSTSSIPSFRQQFSSTSEMYNDFPNVQPLPTTTASTTSELEIDILKPTSTTARTQGNIWWGIGVPGTITRSGDYTGQNTFISRVAEALDWE